MNGFYPQPKPASRLQIAKAEKKLTLVTEKDFKREVWDRDKGMCRKCGRKVIKTVSRIPERGECHHVFGRTGDLRFESRGAMLVCCACHEQLTGRVNERWRVVSVPRSKTFSVTRFHSELLNIAGPVGFERVV